MDESKEVPMDESKECRWTRLRKVSMDESKEVPMDESKEVPMDESKEVSMDESKEVLMDEPNDDIKKEAGDALMDVSSEESTESTDESSEEYSEYSESSEGATSESEAEESTSEPEAEEPMEDSAEKLSKESTEECSKDPADELLEADTQYSSEICADAARKQSKRHLLQHLVETINKADCSDVEFICKDGDKVYASKILCTGRSEMLDAMFKSGMSEATSLVIRFPNIHSRALLSIVEFLYTSDIVHYPPTDSKMGFEVIDAAHFFILPYVDKIVETYLLTHVRDIGVNLEQSATMLSTAMEFQFVHERGRYVSLLRLVHILKREWMHRECVLNLSEKAVDFILRHTRQRELKTRHRTKPSLVEYFRFRGVLMWAISNSHLTTTEDAEKFFNQIIPGAKEKLYRTGHLDLGKEDLVWLPGYDVDSAKNGILHVLESHKLCKEAAVRLLTNIEWTQIPPQLFLRIVEPLKLLPDCQLLDIFRCHYSTRPMRVDLRWIHSSCIKVFNRGFSVENRAVSEYNTGSAVCDLPNRPSNEFATWRFIVEGFGYEIQLGFVFWQQLAYIASWNLDGVHLTDIKDVEGCLSFGGSRALHISRRLRQHDAGIRSGLTKPGEKKWPLNVSSLPVEFRYNQFARDCSIKMGDEDLGLIWKGLPRQGFSPALSISTASDESNVIVRTEVVCGFDFV